MKREVEDRVPDFAAAVVAGRTRTLPEGTSMSQVSGTLAGAAAQPRRRRLTQRQIEEILAYVFISPWLIGFIILTFGAMLFSLGLSTFDTDLLSDSTFVGMKNYLDLSKDPLFAKSLTVTFLYTILVVPLGTTIA